MRQWGKLPTKGPQNLLLVFAEEWQMKENRKRSSVRCENDNLRNTTVQCLGCLVGTFLQLAEMRRLLDNVEDFLGKSCVGDWPGCS